MGLFGPAWKGKNKEKALKWVKGSEDQAKLARAAREGTLPDVREAALRKLEDQKVIADAALHDPDWEVRRTAVWQLKDQDALKQAAGKDPVSEVRESALLSITDEQYLVSYAAQINSDRLARYAMERVTSQRWLALAAATNGWSSVVRNSLKKLGNEPSEEAIAILRQGKDPQVKDYLIPYLTKAEREQIALGDSDWKRRKKAILTLENREVLYRAATEDAEPECRRAAYERLRQLKKEIPAEWWEANIVEGLKDQQLPIRAKAAETDPDAAAEVAGKLADGAGEALYPFVTMPVVEALEKLVSGGNQKAEKALYQLYKSEALNPALAGHAAKQKKRFFTEHRDAMVESTLCGETYRHEDFMRDESIRPL